ncbi:glycosyltransferase [Alphaproteobacteria bacterium]|nr:glycosyltransferase [Alphaproteobacteria bacterium]
MKLGISLIVPTYNEEKNVNIILHNIKLINAKENLIVDGNSTDKTKFFLKSLNIISTEPSRGLQLATGAKNSSQLWFLFVHADTKLNLHNVDEIKNFLKKKFYNKVAYFHLSFNSSSTLSKLTSIWANFRTRYFKLPYGDQCLLISKKYYEKLGGFKTIAVMEDMDLMLRIPKNNKYFFKTHIETSFHKYNINGFFKQSFNNIIKQIRFLLK